MTAAKASNGWTGWRWAIALSLIGHAIIGTGGSMLGIGARQPTPTNTIGSSDVLLAGLDLADPAPAHPAPAPEDAGKPDAAASTPELERVAPPPVPPPPEDALRLGVEKSSANTPNWLGFSDPTPHHARKSEVEQPALDPKAGAAGPLSGGTPGDQGSVPSEPVPETDPLAPAEPTVDEPSPFRQPTDAVDQPNSARPLNDQRDQAADRDPRAGAKDGVDRTSPDLMEPEPSPTDEDVSDSLPQLPVGTMLDSDLPNGPDRPEGSRDPHAPTETVIGFVGPPVPIELGVGPPVPVETRLAGATARRTRPAVPPTREIPPEAARPPASITSPPSPPAVSRSQPASPGSGAGSGPTAANGSGVEHAGEVSEKESDASSLQEALEVIPGRPAAAQGVELITRRPAFSRYTRTVAAPRNPLLRVTFNSSGVVTDARIVRSSGFADVDDPVLNAAYQWTARGERIASAGPAGLTLSIEIILR